MKADLYSLIIYLGNLALTMLLCRIYQKKPILQEKYKWLSLVIISLPLSLVAGLRENVGTDYLNYTGIIDSTRGLSYASIFRGETPNFIEIGFILVTKICSSLNPNSYFLPFFVYAFSTLFLSVAGIERFKQKVSLPLGVFLFYLIYYHVTLNIIRQGMSGAVLMFALKDLVDKNYIRYSIFVLIAFFFHRTAALCLIFMLIPLFSGKYTNEGSYIPGSRRIWGLIPFVILFMAASVPLYNSLFLYDVFANRADFSIEAHGITGSGLGILFFFCVNIYFIIILERRFLMAHQETAVVRDLSYLYLPVQILGYYMPYTDRLILYIDVAFIFLILFSSRETKYGKLVMWYAIILHGYRYVTDILIQGQTETFPYHSMSLF